MAESAALLVDEVFPEQPVRQWVLSFPYPLRFLFASRPAIMGQVLGIVYRVLAGHLIRKAGFTRKTARTGAVTLIQRFGSALNLNLHFHLLFLDGVYVVGADGTVAWFRSVRAPTPAELTELTQTIAERVGHFLQRQGLLARDGEQRFLAGEAMDEGTMDPLLAHSITYRIAVGPQAGRKVFTLQTLPASEAPFDDPVGQVAGFSLHAGVAAKAHQRQKLERLCRYISRPAVSEPRLSLTPNGNVRYQLKTPYRDGTTHVIFQPLEFMAHLLVRHPSGDLRSCKSAVLPICHRPARRPGAKTPGQPHALPWRVCPQQWRPCAGDTGEAGAGRPTQGLRGGGRENAGATPGIDEPQAQRLKRVFGIDIETRSACGGALRIIACIEDPAVIKKILAHLDQKDACTSAEPSRLPPCRAPPLAGLFD